MHFPTKKWGNFFNRKNQTGGGRGLRVVWLKTTLFPDFFDVFPSWIGLIGLDGQWSIAILTNLWSFLSKNQGGGGEGVCDETVGSASYTVMDGPAVMEQGLMVINMTGLIASSLSKTGRLILRWNTPQNGHHHHQDQRLDFSDHNNSWQNWVPNCLKSNLLHASNNGEFYVYCLGLLTSNWVFLTLSFAPFGHSSRVAHATLQQIVRNHKTPWEMKNRDI